MPSVLIPASSLLRFGGGNDTRQCPNPEGLMEFIERSHVDVGDLLNELRALGRTWPKLGELPVPLMADGGWTGPNNTFGPQCRLCCAVLDARTHEPIDEGHQWDCKWWLAREALAVESDVVAMDGVRRLPRE